MPHCVTTLATTIYSGPTALSIAGVVVLVVGGFLTFKGYRELNRNPVQPQRANEKICRKNNSRSAPR